MFKYLGLFATFLCLAQCAVLNTTHADNLPEKDISFTSTFAGTIGNTGVIPNGYIPSPAIGVAHKVHMWKLPWNKARKICYNEGAHLAVIHSSTEKSVILDIMKQRNIPDVWVGLHDLFEKSDWTTVTGAPLASTEFVDWIDGEPNNQGGNEHCAELKSTGVGGMNDIPCEQEKSFVCTVKI